MSVRRLVRYALLGGLLAGVLLAVLLPRGGAPGGGARSRPPLLIGSSSDGPVLAGDPHHEIRGPVRIAVRAADPGGRAPWAVRLFDDRAVIDHPRRMAYQGAWVRCAQLGRIVAGRFGWITPAGDFTPVAPEDAEAAPRTCLTARRLGRRDAATALVSLLADGGRDGAPARTIAFGRTGRQVTGVTLTDRGRPVRGAAGGGGFLTFGPPDPGPRDLRLRLRFSHARPVNRDLSGLRVAGPVDRGHQQRPIAGTERIVARAPDPEGGPPYGILAARAPRAGEWCPAQAARVVGRRGGVVDGRLGTFVPLAYAFTCPNHRYPLTRRTPLGVSIAGSIGRFATGGAGRIQRRSQPGSTIVSGRAHTDVRTLEIATSRDVRTLQPDPITHSFLTAYDGTLPRESITITATFTDGTHRTIVLAHGP